MKTIIGALILVFVMWIVANNVSGTPLEYVKEETMEVVEEPKEAWMTDEDAIKAAQDVVKKKELQAELDGLKEAQASTSARIKELEKELGTY